MDFCKRVTWVNQTRSWERDGVGRRGWEGEGEEVKGVMLKIQLKMHLLALWIPRRFQKKVAAFIFTFVFFPPFLLQCRRYFL